jgi:ABC-2 type transport system permease protein
VNATYFRIELLRVLRDPIGLFFTAVLPAFLFVIFGASQGYTSDTLPSGRGNVSFYIMISMAAYGAVTATTNIGGMAAVERMQGWGRQLGLTPMRDAQYVLVKAVLGLTIAAIPVTLIYTIGFATTARADGWLWLVTAAIVLLGAASFSLYGLVFGLAFKTEGAVSAASGSLVILSFLGNLFFPLTGTLLTVAKLTPLYGIVALARHPLTEGYLISTTGPPTGPDSIWIAVANVAAWLVIFAGLAVIFVRRGRGRQ